MTEDYRDCGLAVVNDKSNTARATFYNSWTTEDVICKVWELFPEVMHLLDLKCPRDSNELTFGLLIKQ